MTKETEIIKLAKVKNGKAFQEWLDNTSSQAVDIKKIREITKKINYSMVDETSK